MGHKTPPPPPPTKAVVARFARASLTATEWRGGSILRDSLLTELGLAPYAPLTVQNQFVFKKQGPLQWWVLSKKVTFFAALVKLHFLAAKCKGIPDTVNAIILRSKKIIYNGAAGEKKIGYGVRMLLFTPESLNKTFFAEQKMKMAPQAKKLSCSPGRLRPSGKYWQKKHAYDFHVWKIIRREKPKLIHVRKITRPTCGR